MADTNQTSLTAGNSSGSQTNTSTPQAAGVSPTLTANKGATGVQPGTANNLLTSTNGIPLGTSQLSTVSLNSAVTTTSTAAPAKPVHHRNPVFVGLTGVLFIAAIGLFWAASRAEKTTTN